MRPLRFRGWSLSLRRGLHRTPRYGLTQTLMPGQVVLPPGCPLTDEEAERMNGGPSDVIRLVGPPTDTEDVEPRRPTEETP